MGLEHSLDLECSQNCLYSQTLEMRILVSTPRSRFKKNQPKQNEKEERRQTNKQKAGT